LPVIFQVYEATRSIFSRAESFFNSRKSSGPSWKNSDKIAFRAQDANRDFFASIFPRPKPHDEYLNNPMNAMFQNRVQPHNEEELKKKIGSVPKNCREIPTRQQKF
jgi:hypothetical protein